MSVQRYMLRALGKDDHYLDASKMEPDNHNSPVSPADLKEMIDAIEGVDIVDNESDRLWLVEATEAGIKKLMESHSGWSVFPEKKSVGQSQTRKPGGPF